MGKLVDKLNLDAYNYLYNGSGMDHSYPNENFVRLERWYFANEKGGYVLDHGFGSGENLIHLLRRGYTVEGTEISEGAIQLVDRKLHKKVSHLRSKANLTLMNSEARELPYKNNTFDYIVSMGVLEMLASRETVVDILNELQRVLKPEGKMILSTVGVENQFCKRGEKIDEDVYLYIGKEGHEKKEVKWRMYIFRNEAHIKEVFSMFQIDEVGWFDNHYCNVWGFHFVVLARK